MFILAHAVTSPTEGGREVSQPWMAQLASSVLPSLAAAQSKQFKINAIGLLKKLLTYKDLTRCLMQYQGKTSLASVLKKMLLSRDDLLQVASVQCTIQVLVHDNAQCLSSSLSPCRPSYSPYTEELLNADMAELLCEALATTNSLLLSSTFCCLLLMTAVGSFFTKCHTVYSIESIIRAVQQSAKLNSSEALKHGLELLSEIFKKQPVEIHLLSNDTTLRQLCSLLTDTLTNPELDIVVHSTRTLSNLLRKDHLPMPINFASLISLLQALLDSLQRLPRPLVASSNAHRNKHRSRQGTGDCTAHSRQEMAISTGMEAIHQAFRLVSACQNNPSILAESQFTAPSSQASDIKTQQDNVSLSSLVTFLMQAVDRTCIPIVMINLDNLTREDIFLSLFSTLCIIMKSGLTNVDKFTDKLASTSFIQVALMVKERFQTTDGGLDNVISSFLSELCYRLDDAQTSSDERQESRDSMLQALPQIQGSASEMLSLLYELPTPPPPLPPHDGLHSTLSQDRMLRLKQQTCLAILLHAYKYNDKLVPEIPLGDAIAFFLCNHPNLKTISKMSSSHVLFLLAMCRQGLRGDGPMAAGPGVQSFLTTLQDGDLSRVYTHHPCIIDWCLDPNFQYSQFAQQILEQWLLHYSSGQETKGTITSEDHRAMILKLLATNPKCFQFILTILSSAQPHLARESLSFLRTVFCQPVEPTNQGALPPVVIQSLLQPLQARLPDVIQRIFLSEDQVASDVHIVALLQLMCTIHQNYPQTVLNAADVKLTYHVTNLLSKAPSSDPGVLRECLNYLTCLLIWAKDSEESRVVSIILSSISTLKFLEDALSRSTASSQLVCCCLSILPHVILLQAQFNIKVHYTMTLRLTRAMEILNTNRHTLTRVCFLQVWTALFKTRFRSPVIRLDQHSPSNSSSSSRIAVEEGEVEMDLPDRVIDTLYIWLQNFLLKGDPLLGQAASTCMRHVIAYSLQKCTTLGDNLLTQPWNHRLLSACVETGVDSGYIPPHVLQLITMYLQHGNRDSVVRMHHIADAVVTLKSMSVAGCGSIQGATDAVQFVQQLTVRDDIKLTQETLQTLQSFLKLAADNQKYQALPWVHPVIRVEGTVLHHPAAFLLNSQSSAQLVTTATELGRELTRIEELRRE